MNEGGSSFGKNVFLVGAVEACSILRLSDLVSLDGSSWTKII